MSVQFSYVALYASLGLALHWFKRINYQVNLLRLRDVTYNPKSQIFLINKKYLNEQNQKKTGENKNRKK